MPALDQGFCVVSSLFLVLSCGDGGKGDGVTVVVVGGGKGGGKKPISFGK